MPYEIRFYRGNGAFSVQCFVNCASDRHAVSSARLLLDGHLTSAEIWQDNRRVANVAWAPPKIAA